MKTGISFAACLVMLQAWVKPFWGPDFTNWSLSVETFCYILFPFVEYLIWKIRGPWIWISMAALYVAGRALVVLAVSGAVAHGINYELIFFWPPFHLSVFLMGVLLAELLATSESVGQERTSAFRNVICRSDCVLQPGLFWSPGCQLHLRTPR
jgi:peptidoglycan/LPS O-acetylase OafA/YrhL